MNKRKDNHTDTASKKVVALESTKALPRQKASKTFACPVDAWVILEIYISCETNGNLRGESNITRFGEWHFTVLNNLKFIKAVIIEMLLF